MKFLRASIPSTIEIEERINGSSYIMGDSTAFHQIIMNICTNAAQSMQEKGGLLRVSLDDVEVDDHFVSLYPQGNTPAHEDI